MASSSRSGVSQVEELLQDEVEDDSLYNSILQEFLQEKVENDSFYESMIDERSEMRTKIGETLPGQPKFKKEGDGIVAYLEDTSGHEYVVGVYCRKDGDIKLHWKPPEAL